MASRFPTREQDEIALWLVRARAAGMSAGEAGRRLGIASAKVRTITNRILTDDLRLSGEDRAEVASAYWGFE